MTHWTWLHSEETQEDVEARMRNIQENEVTQLRDLTNLLNLEITFVQQHLDVLKDAKAGWIDECVCIFHLLRFWLLT